MDIDHCADPGCYSRLTIRYNELNGKANERTRSSFKYICFEKRNHHRQEFRSSQKRLNFGGTQLASLFGVHTLGRFVWASVLQRKTKVMRAYLGRISHSLSGLYAVVRLQHLPVADM